MAARRTTVGAAGVLGAAGMAAGSGTIMGFGVPAPWVSTSASGVSANGLVVVGTGTEADGTDHAWRWTVTGGLVELARLPGGTKARVSGVSADGAIAVGWATDSTDHRRAVRWTGIGPGAIQDLGELSVGAINESYAASANGTIVVGKSGSSFRWVALQGMQDLAALSGGLSVRGVSGDGLTYTGSFPVGVYLLRNAVTWTSAGGIVDLGLPRGFDYESESVLASADGSVVAGALIWYGPMVVVPQAFRWTPATGARLIGMTQPQGMTPAGDVIVGMHQHVWRPGDPPPAYTAALWTAPLGSPELQDYLVGRGVDVTGWELWFATGVSEGGRVIVGQGNHTVGGVGRVEAYVVALDGGVPTCYANCDLSTATPVLNVADFSCFMNRFAQHDAYANCDGSTVAPVLNVQDFVCFLNRFSAGCS